MIRLTQVEKVFGKRRALRSASFVLRRGEVVALLGHNGAGKTTTLRLMTGLLEPTSGRVDVLDHEVGPTLSGRAFKERLGYVPDEPFLYPYLTGREMLELVGSLYRLAPDRLARNLRRHAESFELAPALEQLLHGWSRGMKRKLSLAASLLHEPLYWLLDEPTESLDPVAIRVLKQRIVEHRDDRRAVLISTHQLGLAEELCDRLVILHEGSVVFEGTISELRRTAGGDLSSLEEIYFRVFGLGAGVRPGPRAETSVEDGQ
jgi:ABC-2 type transport system ATP-binding protein